VTIPRKENVPPFTLRGVKFECWVVSNGIGGTRYEWRSDDDQRQVWRDGSLWWVKVDGKLVGRNFMSLMAAMTAAVEAVTQRERATA
jgi:hypothetical protein